MTTIYSDLAYVQARGDGGPRSHTQVIVTHATDNTASARDEANYAAVRPDLTSAHFYVDENEVIQALPLDRIAYGCLYHGNQISVQFELCGVSNRLSDATLRRAAPIVARVMSDLGLPNRKINSSEVAAGVHGLCGHADITYAFPQDGGDHTDPGDSFPWPTYVGYINESLNPSPTPTTTPEVNVPFGQLPTGFAFDETPDANWIDTKKARAVTHPKVGPAGVGYGGAWLNLSGIAGATVRYAFFVNGTWTGWSETTLDLFHVRTGIPLPNECVATLLGRRRTAADDTNDDAPVDFSIEFH